MKWKCVGCGQGVDAHCNPITGDEHSAWCYDCAEEIERVVAKMNGARCRNCGNTGISPWTGKPCGCPVGKALARLQADNGVEDVTPVADDETTKQCRCEACGVDTWCSREPLYIGKYVVSHIWLCNACVVERAQERMQLANNASEPRTIIQAFAQAMERKLAANDGMKGGWRAATTQADMRRWKALRHLKALREEVAELEDALIRMDSLRREVSAEQVRNILMEAADVSLYALMIADVCGALPPTDERGR